MRERDDEDLALEQIENSPALTEDRLEPALNEPPAISIAGREYVSSGRERLYALRDQHRLLREQLEALPLKEARELAEIPETIAAIHAVQQRDRRPRRRRDRAEQRWRTEQRERRLEELAHRQAELSERIADPEAIIERGDQLEAQRSAVFSELLDVHSQTVSEEVAARPPWLEASLGPEPEKGHLKDRWNQTAGHIAAERIDRHITDPHIAIDDRAPDLALARDITDTRVALGLDRRGPERDVGIEM